MRSKPVSTLQQNENLCRLASALGGTVASVFGEPAESGELAALSELLRLWAALNCDASRADALEAVRDIARAQSLVSAAV